MSYSIDSLTQGCYPETSCLINNLDLRDETILAEYEAIITTAKAAMLEQQPINGTFDFEHYKAIHKFLFEEIYDWAGKIRTVDMSKKGTSFVKAKDIEHTAAMAFRRLNEKQNFTGMLFEAFIDNIADFYNVLNMLHPFREGNGRTQRVFFTQLIRNAGYDINFSEIDTDELMIATILAAGGIEDSLRSLFYRAIHKASKC